MSMNKKKIIDELDYKLKLNESNYTKLYKAYMQK